MIDDKNGSGNLSIDDPRFQRQIRHLHELGERTLAEFVAAVENDPTREVRQRLARFAGIDRSWLEASGGNRFPPRLLLVQDNGAPIKTGLSSQAEILRRSLPSRDGGSR